MAYLIYRSDGTPITIPDNTIDNLLYNPQGGGGYGTGNASQPGQGLGVQLLGRNASNYGQVIAQSFVQLTENFASSTVPNDNYTLQGQLWFQQSSNSTGNLFVKVNNNTTGGIANWNQLIMADSSGNVTVPNLTVQGTLSLTSPLPVASGGTGTNTLSNFINQLLPSQVNNAGMYLTTNGTDVSWATVTSSGNTGTSFPLTQSTLSDATNSDIAWVGSNGTLGQYNTSRIRGILSDGTNNLYLQSLGANVPVNMMFEIYDGANHYVPQTTYAANWVEAMSFVDYPVYGGNTPAVHIPNLVVDNLYNYSAVNDLSTSPVLSVSSSTGYVYLALTSPALAMLTTPTGISTVETTITNERFAYGTPQYPDGPVGYRMSVIGTFSSSAAGQVYFNVYYGTNTGTMNLNTPIAQWSAATAGAGTDAPFKFDVDIYIAHSSLLGYYPIATASLISMRSTGIIATPNYMFEPSAPTSSPSSTPIVIGLTAYTSDANNVMNITASRIEAII